MTRDEFAAYIQAIAINQLAGRNEPLTPKSVEEQIRWNCASFRAAEISEGYDRRDLVNLVLTGYKPFNFEVFLTECEATDRNDPGHFDDVLDFMRTN